MNELKLNINDTDRTIVERIFEHAYSGPENPAIICDDEIVTYRDLKEMILNAYSCLREKGIEKNDKVLVQSIHNKYCTACYYAVHLLNAVLVPFEKNAPQERVLEIADNTDAKLIISRNDTGRDWCSYDEIAASVYRNEWNGQYPDIDSDCEMVFTTGTTGKSKGVLITHRNMSWYTYAIAKATQMKEGNRFFITTPLNHAGGLRRTHLSLANGCCVIYMDGLMNLKKYFAYIENYRATSLYLPPVAIRVLMNSAKDELMKYQDQIDFVYSSSSPIPAGDCELLREMLPKTRLYNAYEASETPGVSLYDYNTDQILKGCMGKANEGVELAILKEDGNITKDIDISGQICIKSPMNMHGYYKAEEISASVFKDGWFVSSDLGHFDEEGNIYYDGRKGDVINIAGYKIAPTDVEEVALLDVNIRECICVEAENKLGMPVLKLLVVPKNENFDSKALTKLIASKLEPYKVPKLIETIDEVHKTFNGKIDRKYYRK
ncbi:MAG: acyl--CoA ligase [Erysipelotrichaceae bacterium]|nr:acyl--CoA ligase [Erysipelotrichaceae bacterium]